MNLGPSIKYRVTGPAVFGPHKQATDRIKIGDVVFLDNGQIDEDGDVWTKKNGFIRASSLTPVTDSDDIRIPRADLPEVVHEGIDILVDGKRMSPDVDYAGLRQSAYNALAVVEFLERRESEAAAAEERRNKRRDELLAELAPEELGPDPAAGRLRALNAAIDRIIEMEEEAAK